MPLDRFALDLDRFTQSTSPPLAPEQAVNLDRFAQSTPPPLAPEHAVDLDRFTDTPPIKPEALYQGPRLKLFSGC
jgi:hypothetical protein